MAGLEGKSGPDDALVEPVTGPGRPEQVDARDLGTVVPEGRSLDAAGPTNHLAYKDRPLTEFRDTKEHEFIEPKPATYPIEPFREPRRIVERTNPNYGDPSFSYDQNCADCARSFERSWRGNFEEAAGRAPQITASGEYTPIGESSRLTEEWAGEQFRDVYRADDLRTTLDQSGHGTSAIVHTRFMDADGASGAHAYNVVNYRGKIEVCDPQLGEVFDWAPETIHPKLGPHTEHTAMAWDAKGNRRW